MDKCRQCRCIKNGGIICKQRRCPKPKCGISKQLFPSDECCPSCNHECNAVKCSVILNCPTRLQMYEDNACCPTCGCRYKGQMIPEGVYPII